MRSTFLTLLFSTTLLSTACLGTAHVIRLVYRLWAGRSQSQAQQNSPVPGLLQL